MILYTEEDETKYCFYLIKSLEEFNKTTEQDFKYENDAIRYAIEYMIEEQQWTIFEMCTDCDDMTTCEHNVCSLYLTQFHLIPKQAIIDSINNCNRLDDIIEDEIDDFLDYALDDLNLIEEKYNIKIYIKYEWDYDEVE